MRDRTYWLPAEVCSKEYEGKKRVYIKHYHAPFAGYLAAADTAFSIPAFFRVGKSKRVHGFVTPNDGMAFQQEHGELEFVSFKGEKS